MCGKSGDILVEWATEIPSEGSGISRWAVAALAGMEWPHSILFGPHPSNFYHKPVFPGTNQYLDPPADGIDIIAQTRRRQGFPAF